MGKIVKKKKKGRPPKADLDRRVRLSNDPQPGHHLSPLRRREPDLRRSTRRRSITYIEDFYDDLFDDLEEEDEDISKPNGVSKGFEAVVQTQGKLSDSSKGVLVPDRQQLEMILDKLQKKDTYGVYAEPVDPEELPDYHDVIEYPMDFGTVRKKLQKGAYVKLEQFENDIDLICTNAMQYNAPETIYFKQARSIQELAKKKFQRLRIESENAVAELKSEEIIKPISIVKKAIKRSSCKPIQEPVGSDFSSGATLATVGDTCTMSNATQAGGYEKPSIVDGQVDGNSSLTESKPEKTEEQQSGKGTPSKLGRKPVMLDENRRATYNLSNQPVVRTESMCTIFEGENKQLVSVGPYAEHSYARSLARFAAVLGPAAWKIASRRIEQALPVGMKFGRGWVGEYEPLPTPVLMLENHSQKQSGAKKLPSKSTTADKTAAGMKVTEHGSLPTPVLTIANQAQRQLGNHFQGTTESRKDKFAEGSKVSKNDMQIGLRTINSSGSTASCKSQDPAKERHFANPTSEGKLGLFGVSGSKSVTNATYQQQKPASMNNVKSDNMLVKQVELLRSSSGGNSNGFAPQKQMDMVSRNREVIQSVPFKQSEKDGVVSGRVPNGKTSSTNNHQASSLPFGVVSNQQARSAVYFPQGNHDQGLSDPVQMMRMLAEKTQNQQKSLNLAAIDGRQSTPSNPSTRQDDSNAAATVAARAWMTLGAAHFKAPDGVVSPKMQIAATSLYNPAKETPQSISRNSEESPVSRGQFHGENNKLPPQVFLPQPSRAGDESRFQNSRQMFFPQLVTTDLSRFQMQSSWRGLVPHTQPIKKQDTLPPDLNISFQSSGSPVRQSSGAMVDSQQPDLALQL
ncbi:Bromodomain-containing protein [Thalictrum thalictroides]|uniref:Bromodomain-containing protein n=1 Tax=Thalictrum thalictroides TaxID=46969 RepID=A0A7J6XE15_THATH|nr:Bromodomain-containing protein [Thalictrum thalictroides]